MYIIQEDNTYKKREGRNLQSYSLINITQRNVIMHSVQSSGVSRVGHTICLFILLNNLHCLAPIKVLYTNNIRD